MPPSLPPSLPPSFPLCSPRIGGGDAGSQRRSAIIGRLDSLFSPPSRSSVSGRASGRRADRRAGCAGSGHGIHRAGSGLRGGGRSGLQVCDTTKEGRSGQNKEVRRGGGAPRPSPRRASQRDAPARLCSETIRLFGTHEKRRESINAHRSRNFSVPGDRAPGTPRRAAE